MSAARTIAPARGPLVGDVRMPGDKSIGHRAVLLNGLAEGSAVVTGLPDGEDVASTIAAMRMLGATIEDAGPNRVRITGCGLRLVAPSGPIDCGNSGTSMRLLMGVLAGSRIEARLVGDASLSRRPMERVAVPLRQLGADIETRDGRPPVFVRGRPLSGCRVLTNVASAQVKSALLLAGLQADGTTVVVEPELTRDHSERMLSAMGVELARSDEGVCIVGPAVPHALDVDVCGDASSAAFFAVAASLVAGSDVLIRDIGVNPTRIGFVRVLERMGADIALIDEREVAGEPVADLRVRSARLRATDIGGAEIPACIDELPILAVAAAAASGVTRIRDAGELRVKESDRIATVAAMLATLGARVTEHADGLSIVGGSLNGGATIDAAGDHRIAMSGAIAALPAKAPVTIEGAAVAAVSFPAFYDTIEALQDG